MWRPLNGIVEAHRTAAQAAAADVETARLSFHAELALDYFTLRGLDREQALLDTTVAAYERALELTQNRFQGGLASQADVALAETQLETTRAQAVDVAAVRTSLEHAIAVLVGGPAPAFALAASPLTARRRRFRSACRRTCSSGGRTSPPRMARMSASAQVGVATAAFIRC